MRIRNWILAALIALPAVAAPAQGPIETPGTVSHRAADAHFPERVGDFRRANAFQYDAAGEDMSASYALARGGDRLLVTVYVYPASRLTAGASPAQQCEGEFRDVADAVTARNPTARQTDRQAAPAVADVEPSLTHRATFQMRANFAGEEQPVRSEAYLYCFVGGDWLVKYRATSDASFDASADIEAFIRAGPWPGRAAPPDPAKIAALTAPARS